MRAKFFTRKRRGMICYISVSGTNLQYHQLRNQLIGLIQKNKSLMIYFATLFISKILWPRFLAIHLTWSDFQRFASIEKCNTVKFCSKIAQVHKSLSISTLDAIDQLLTLKLAHGSAERYQFSSLDHDIFWCCIKE